MGGPLADDARSVGCQKGVRGIGSPPATPLARGSKPIHHFSSDRDFRSVSHSSGLGGPNSAITVPSWAQMRRTLSWPPATMVFPSAVTSTQ
jgi:hypothetical protein